MAIIIFPDSIIVISKVKTQLLHCEHKTGHNPTFMITIRYCDQWKWSNKIGIVVFLLAFGPLIVNLPYWQLNGKYHWADYDSNFCQAQPS